MTWTTTAPTGPGFYWYRYFRYPGKIGHVWRDNGTGKLHLFEFDGGGHMDVDLLSCEWAGPIPHPTEPTPTEVKS